MKKKKDDEIKIIIIIIIINIINSIYYKILELIIQLIKKYIKMTGYFDTLNLKFFNYNKIER